MGYTDQSGLYAAVTEDGFNHLVAQVMAQRPSLFAYGTPQVAKNWRKLLCAMPAVAKSVQRHGNPVVTIEKPLPLIGTGGMYGLEFGLQLTALRVDLHPQSASLPVELGELGEQQFSLIAQVCAGLGCPDEDESDRVPAAPQPGSRPPEPARPVTLPFRGLQCCCLELAVVGHFELTGPEYGQHVAPRLDGLEIVDVSPAGLEDNIECYLRLLLRYVLLPRLEIAVSAFHFGILDNLAVITLSPTTSVPNNPAVEDDTLKIFVDVEVGA